MNIDDFRPVPPAKLTPDQLFNIDQVNVEFEATADFVISDIPSSAHRTAALRLLLEAKMTLTHGITHPQAPEKYKMAAGSQDAAKEQT